MAKVISTWFYEAAINVQETIEDDTVEKATQKAHQQLKPGENAKYNTSDMRFLKKLVKMEKKNDDRTKDHQGSGTKGK